METHFSRDIKKNRKNYLKKSRTGTAKQGGKEEKKKKRKNEM